MSNWYQKITKTKFDTIQVKILSQIEPKIDEDGEKFRKSNLALCKVVAHASVINAYMDF